jgi:hypothetical protein
MRSHRVLFGLLLLIGLAACGEYLTTVQPVEDEVLVKLVTDRAGSYNHPVRITAVELGTLLENVRVEYKANWLQTLIAGPLKPVRLFEQTSLARVVPALAKAFEQAGQQDRVVFYLAERRSEIRREVTSGSLFVIDRLLHIVVTNHRNGVDVVPGVPTHDRRNPEWAVAPQRFLLTFEHPEFVVKRETSLIQNVFGADPPILAVDYRPFLNMVARQAALQPPPERH